MRRLLSLALILGACTANAQGPRGATGLRAARALARGDTLAIADIVADSGVSTDPHTIVGLVARRMIRQGELLGAPGIGAPIVVHAGAVVTVRVTVGGVVVSRDGVALHDAGMGETVHVRLNLKSTVAAVVRDPSTVDIR